MSGENPPEVYYTQIVGQVIRSRRQILGISVGSMGALLGSNQSGLSRIETGSTAMTISQLCVMARHLKMKPWCIIQAADNLVETWEQQGVKVNRAGRRPRKRRSNDNPD